jgi:HPr kinase/phosphorylase
MIFVYDTEEHVGAVWMRDHGQIDVRCCVAPFRVLLSWMADTFDGEIIHASGAEINGKGVLISGSSGSGKSSLAIYSGFHGGKILSDDAVLIEGSEAFAIYSRAKVAKVNPVLNLEKFNTFELRNSTEGKIILPLEEFQTSFIFKMNYDAIVFPEVVHMTHIEKISSLIGYKYFIEQSLRELFGGDKNNLARHSKLLTRIPNFRMALSGDISKDYNCLVQQIGSI